MGALRAVPNLDSAFWDVVHTPRDALGLSRPIFRNFSRPNHPSSDSTPVQLLEPRRPWIPRCTLSCGCVNAIAASLFGLIKGSIGGANQLFRRRKLFPGCRRDADAHGERGANRRSRMRKLKAFNPQTD